MRYSIWLLSFLLAIAGTASGCRNNQGSGLGAAKADPEEKEAQKKKKKRKKKKKKKKGKKKKKKATDESPLPVLPDPIATIEGKPIPLATFMELYQPRYNTILGRRDDDRVPNAWQRRYRKKISERLIWEHLLELETKASGVDYDRKKIANYERNQRVENWAEHLERIQETEGSLKARNVAFYRERAHMGKRGVLEATADDIATSYQENKEHFEREEEHIRVAHFLIAVGPREKGGKIMVPSRDTREKASKEHMKTWEAAALARATKLRTAALKLKTDQAFMDFVRRYSEGPGAFRGGDMGVFDRNRMVPEYTDVVFAQKVGTLSEPFKSDKGYFVSRLMGRYPPGLLPVDAMEGDIRRDVERRKVSTLKKSLEEELYAKFRVDNRVLPTIDEPQRGAPLPVNEEAALARDSQPGG
ncbi:MAG: peptidylprolyl isomerase [Nannocystaceae bacterium]